MCVGESRLKNEKPRNEISAQSISDQLNSIDRRESASESHLINREPNESPRLRPGIKHPSNRRDEWLETRT